MRTIAAVALLTSFAVFSHSPVAVAGPTKPDVSDGSTVNDCKIEDNDTPLDGYEGIDCPDE